MKPDNKIQNEVKWITTSHFNFDFFSFNSACTSYTTAMKDLLGFSFNYKYHNLDIYYDENDFARHEEQLVQFPELIERQLNFIEDQSKKLIEISEKLGKNNDLESFQMWHKAYVEFLPTLGIVVAPERVLARKLKEFLSEDKFSAISFSDETATAFELKSLLTIARGDYVEEELNKLIDEHAKKYDWLGNKWMTYNPFTHDGFIERIESMKGKAGEQLSELIKTRGDMEKRLQEILETLTSDQKKLVAQYRRLLYWRTGRGEAAALSCSLTLPLFTWIGNQIGLNRAQVVKYSFEEISQLQKTGQKVKNPDERKLFNAEMINGNLNVVWNPDAKPEGKKEAVDSFPGTIANKGFVRGVVRIIHDLPDLKNFKEGEILVAASTNPNMVTAMQKAAAYVTDVGGLTSHAAIISRELNIPCLIATKIATKVLKNGDEIEVDADKGIVKVLRRS
jgi:phosphohistidine swiveling domain-containing protein